MAWGTWTPEQRGTNSVVRARGTRRRTKSTGLESRACPTPSLATPKTWPSRKSVGFSGLSPDLELEFYVKEGRAARVVLEASEGANLLVVGSRGRGGFAGLLLGSVRSQVAHHAHCPATVVHV